jgi:CheY-like chemotaxis protein
VFEPFFTTKPEGKGTGLGLATLSTIVQRHGGTVELSSAPGKGATFSVYLPCVKQRPPRAEHPHQAVARSGSGSGETILVVEDDQALRAITVRALTRAGYHVLCAESGPRALEVWKVQRESIRMLLTDLVMPGGIPGRELARMLSADMPTLRVVYTSGYSDDIAGRELGPHERFLAKPYTPERLADVVRACLSAAS